jgi:hypothetical protein
MKRIVVAILTAALALAACEGPAGPAGTDGAAGAQGPAGTPGGPGANAITMIDSNGATVGTVVVIIHASNVSSYITRNGYTLPIHMTTGTITSFTIYRDASTIGNSGASPYPRYITKNGSNFYRYKNLTASGHVNTATGTFTTPTDSSTDGGVSWSTYTTAGTYYEIEQITDPTVLANFDLTGFAPPFFYSY